MFLVWPWELFDTLKLQGKFGKVESSDICSLVELLPIKNPSSSSARLLRRIAFVRDLNTSGLERTLSERCGPVLSIVSCNLYSLSKESCLRRRLPVNTRRKQTNTSFLKMAIVHHAFMRSPMTIEQTLIESCTSSDSCSACCSTMNPCSPSSSS